MSDSMVIVCADWSEEALAALTGNATVECDVCHDRAVVSREGRAHHARHPGATYSCLTCARLAQLSGQAPGEVPRIVPGALERAAQALGVSPEALNVETMRRFRAPESWR